MNNTEYENGVLICRIHRTPISKSHGRFFCLKCQGDSKMITEKEQQEWKKDIEENKRLKKALEDLRTITLRKFSQAEMQCLLLQNIEQALK